jgi:hypothetical protein
MPITNWPSPSLTESGPGNFFAVMRNIALRLGRRSHRRYRAAALSLSVRWITPRRLCSGASYAFEDPKLDARTANVFWIPAICREVFPVIPAPTHLRTLVPLLVFPGLSCLVTILSDAGGNRHHILFAEGIRRFQLELHGALDLPVLALTTPAIASPTRLKMHLHALQRLADLATYRALRPELYPPSHRGRRLARVLQVLDGYLAGATQREIAIAIFNEYRVRRDWSDPRCHLRDQIRRAIVRGRDLMAGAYLKLLQ